MMLAAQPLRGVAGKVCVHERRGKRERRGEREARAQEGAGTSAAAVGHCETD